MGIEVIKLITKQFTPINHTLVYDGIESIGEVYNI